MTALTYTPLTHDSALQLLEIVALVPKRHHFLADNLVIDSAHRASVKIMTNAGVESVRRWFEVAGVEVVKVERIGGQSAYKVEFDGGGV